MARNFQGLITQPDLLRPVAPITPVATSGKVLKKKLTP